MSAVVLTSGCFDMLHIGHVRFLNQAAALGDLVVAVASDETIFRLKGRRPEVREEDRLTMVRALRYVADARLSPGHGILDFEPLLPSLQPDRLVVNFDGDYPEKRTLCAERQIEYVVIQQHTGPHTSTLRQDCRIPYRVDLAGGWLDQPFVSKYYPGPVIVASIEPDLEFQHRSGMATSTRDTAIRMWGCRLPVGPPVEMARWLFAGENPPGTLEVSGSQDALGIVLPGVSRLDYDGSYWPRQIDSCTNVETIEWLESHLRLFPTPPREELTSVLGDARVTIDRAKNLAGAAQQCWQAILNRDLERLASSITNACRAQLAMFPRMLIAELEEAWQSRNVLGAKLCGAGGGGYILAVCDKGLAEGVPVRIRRPDI